jgi:hypothetical protein
MSDSQTWDVACNVCGHKLGSNKATCGRAEPGAGKRAVKFPPCIWAHTDEKYVRKAFAAAAAAAERKKKEEQEHAATMLRYNAGEINFSERQDDDYDGEGAGFDMFSEGEGSDALGQDADGGVDKDGDKEPAFGNEGGAGAAAAASDKGGKAPKHTKWTSMTRTMFYKCIQNKDPFHTGHKDKTPAWEGIAIAMQEATRHLSATAEGDLRCFANGKTLQVFYGRNKRNYKDDDDKHSGGAGRQHEQDDPTATLKREERSELLACMELEKSADDQAQLKRDATKSFDFMKNGVVNDFVVDCAKKDERVKPKLVKELASRLRQAKMRKLAFEESNKGGTYTYTPQDMENFRLWDSVRETFAELPEAENIDGDVPASKKGGHLVTALQELTAQGAQLRQHFTPMSPSAFAAEFFKAKRAHAEETKMTLKQKLQVVADDIADGSITQDESEAIIKRIKAEHYTFGSP